MKPIKHHALRRTGALAAAVLILGSGLAACGDDGDSSNADNSASEAESSMTESESSDSMASGSPDSMASEEVTASGVFGPGCGSLPTEGAGSLEGMSAEPVATAASGNPMLSTLVTAVKQAGLVDTLNSAEQITVFAPTNEAFAKIPPADLKAILKDKKTLTSILTHHVVPQELAPEDVVGEFKTLNGDMLSVTGSGEDLTVGDEEASVVCGNIPTANATVYVIDTVLVP